MGTDEDEPYGSTLEQPRHEVTLTGGFWIGRTPVTVVQWRQIMKGGGGSENARADLLPARGMSWGRAVEFCRALTARLVEAEVLDDGWQVALPTEAQWEYACRAGTRSPWFFGEDASELAHYGWYLDNSGEDLQPVGLKRPNAWGIHDLYGNVMEWCIDNSYRYPRGATTDPCHQDPDGSLHACRGGSCIDSPADCRSASRVFVNQSNPHSEDIGFRIVCIPAPREAGGRPGKTERTARSLWTTPDRARHFIVPDDAALPAGDFPLRTATGRERSVEEAAVTPYEVTEEEAKAWAKEQLAPVLTEMRGKALSFVEQLRARTDAMREENRRTWTEGVASAPEDVREAAEKLRDSLREFGQALQRAAREHGGERPPDAGRPDANPPDDDPPSPR